MHRSLLIMAVLGLFLFANAGQAGQCSAPSVPAGYKTIEVDADGLVAQFLRPKAPGPHAALIVLGGSSGGTESVRTIAKPFAELGYAVLALSYFKAGALPEHLQEIPLEYFRTAVDWLARQPDIDASRMGVFGVSKGAEAALLLASRDDRLKAVIAGSPTHVVWQGINLKDFMPHSSWSENGTPLPFLPYEYGKGFTTVYNLYNDALPAVAAKPEVLIPVEKISGAVLLISGEKDTVWPSSDMGRLIMKRLDEHGVAHHHEHLAYEDAGHAVSIPPSLGQIYKGPDSFVGGSDAGNAAARKAMWAQVVCFLDDTLRREP